MGERLLMTHNHDEIAALPCFSDIEDISPLAGGLTNENYKVTSPEGVFVVRFSEDDPVLGISRVNEKNCLKNAEKLELAPKVVYRGEGVMVSEFIDGKTLTPEMMADKSVLLAVVDSFKTLHNPLHDLEGRIYYVGPYRSIASHLNAIEKYGIETDLDVTQLRDLTQNLYTSLPPFTPVLCHADLVGGNVIYDGEKAWLIDWEYGGMGDPLFDLGWFAVANDMSDASCAFMLEQYYGQIDQEKLDHFNTMRALCALRDGLWGVVQTFNSDLDVDYHDHADKYLDKFEELTGESIRGKANSAKHQPPGQKPAV